MARRLLVLSYAFPPLAAPESILSAKAVRGLLDRGVEVDVVAVASGPWRRRDPDLEGYVSGAAVHRVAEPLWLPVLQPVQAVRRYPDAMRFVRGRARRVVDRLDLDEYDAMLSWSQWHSVHLLALDVKARRPGLRWVAHFSDPWVGNPLVPLGGYAARLADRMEREVVETADVLEFTTPEAAAMMTGRHGGLDTTVIPHCYDERLYDDAAHASPSTARYLGSFYGSRTPEPLLAGLARLQGSSVLEGLQVELVGEIPGRMLQTPAAAALPPGLVRTSSPIRYLESLASMRAAGLLLVVDAPATRNVFLASKLIDYVGAGRPIVAITPPGRAADIVRALGGPVADPTDPSAVADALAEGVALARAHQGSEPWGTPDVRREFAVDRVVDARLQSLFGDRMG